MNHKIITNTNTTFEVKSNDIAELKANISYTNMKMIQDSNHKSNDNLFKKKKSNDKKIGYLCKYDKKSGHQHLV